jgi:hypothetical protein
MPSVFVNLTAPPSWIEHHRAIETGVGVGWRSVAEKIHHGSPTHPLLGAADR